jgi:HPr kinase/phosphorylase
MRFHASCAARPGSGGFDAVLLLGAPGSGKSNFLLRLLDRGWSLVADDQAIVLHGSVSAPAALAGMIEVFGLGLFRLPFLPQAPLRLVVRCGRPSARLPQPAAHDALGVPEVIVDPWLAAAPRIVELALDAALGKAGHIVGAFAA